MQKENDNKFFVYFLLFSLKSSTSKTTPWLPFPICLIFLYLLLKAPSNFLLLLSSIYKNKIYIRNPLLHCKKNLKLHLFFIFSNFYNTVESLRLSKRRHMTSFDLSDVKWRHLSSYDVIWLRGPHMTSYYFLRNIFIFFYKSK